MRLSHDDAVAGLELWNEELIDIGLKGAAVDRSVENHGFSVFCERRSPPTAFGDASPCVRSNARHAGGAHAKAIAHPSSRCSIGHRRKPTDAKIHRQRSGHSRRPPIRPEA